MIDVEKNRELARMLMDASIAITAMCDALEFEAPDALNLVYRPEEFKTPIPWERLSSRTRNVLHGLALNTLGDVATKSSSFFEAVKNCGATSRNEIRKMLSDYGLSIRGERIFSDLPESSSDL